MSIRRGSSLVVGAVLFFCAPAVHAQQSWQPPPPAWQPPPPPPPPQQQPQLQQATPCFPECRPGFVCAPSGQCVSACNPPCGPGLLCAPSGQCVSACNPPCGPGLLCAPSGQCVSACNPPCGPGQVCQGGQCLGTMVGPGPSQQLVLGGPGVAPVMADAGWARGAGAYGIVSMVLLGVAVVAIVAADDADVGIPLGVTATLFTAASVPIIAAGGSSARNAPGVTGSSGLRTGGWIAFGLSILDATVLIGIAASDGDVDPPYVASVGILGEVAVLFFTLDAFGSASQAEELSLGLPAAEGPSLSPFVGLASTASDDTAPVIGFRGSL